jgi:hypothetical protein
MASPPNEPVLDPKEVALIESARGQDLKVVLSLLRNHAGLAAAAAHANAAKATDAAEQYRYEGRMLAWEEAMRLFTTT